MAKPTTLAPTPKRSATVCFDGEAVGKLTPSRLHVFDYLLRNRPGWFLARDMGVALGTLEIHPRLSEITDIHAGLIERKPGPDPAPGQRRQMLYRASSLASLRTSDGER